MIKLIFYLEMFSQGNWIISGDGINNNFEVKKYVLPRFQSIISGPATIYKDSESTSYTICGKYSYGKYVKGTGLLAGKVYHGYSNKLTTFSKIKNVRRFFSIKVIIADMFFFLPVKEWLCKT